MDTNTTTILTLTIFAAAVIWCAAYVVWALRTRKRIRTEWRRAVNSFERLTAAVESLEATVEGRIPGGDSTNGDNSQD